MRFTPTLVALATLHLACSGGSYNQGGDFDGVPDDDTADTDTSTGGGGDEGGDEGSGDDGGDDDEDDDTGPDYCTNAWHPVDQTGWQLDFVVEYNGKTGTGSWMSTAPVDQDAGVYQYIDVVSVASDFGEDGWSVTQVIKCDPEAGEGMYVDAYFGTVYYPLLDLGFEIILPFEVDATLEPDRKYLPPEYAVGSVGSWDYSYTLTAVGSMDTGGPQTLTNTYAGTYVELGEESLTLFDGTSVSAYKLTNTYTQTDEYGATTNGYVEQYWVKGLGLVKELHQNSDTNETILSRELSGYNGLTIAE